MRKYLFVELDGEFIPLVVALYDTPAEVRERFMRRASIFGTEHSYKAYKVGYELPLNFLEIAGKKTRKGKKT